MQRKKQQHNSLKDHRLDIRMNKEAYDSIKKKSQELGVSMSRLMVDSSLGFTIVTLADREMASQIRKIGANMNQLAHYANVNKQMPSNAYMKEHFEPLVLVMKEMLEELKRNK